MRRLNMLAALVVLVLIDNPTQAQGMISWDTGRPRTGSVAGSIEVKGSIRLDAGWRLVAARVVEQAWPEGGGEVEEFVVPMERRRLTWGVFRLTGLKPGASYNVTVDVAVTDGSAVAVLRTAPKIIQAAK